MIYGTVEYVLKDGKKASVEWAARAQMARKEGNGEWKMGFYQVYLVSFYWIGRNHECLSLTNGRILLLCRMLNEEGLQYRCLSLRLTPFKCSSLLSPAAADKFVSTKAVIYKICVMRSRPFSCR
jgi:hypothetical protein